MLNETMFVSYLRRWIKKWPPSEGRGENSLLPLPPPSPGPHGCGPMLSPAGPEPWASTQLRFPRVRGLSPLSPGPGVKGSQLASQKQTLVPVFFSTFSPDFPSWSHVSSKGPASPAPRWARPEFSLPLGENLSTCHLPMAPTPPTPWQQWEQDQSAVLGPGS